MTTLETPAESFRNAVEKILTNNGVTVEDMDVGDAVQVDGGAAFQDLSIELIAENRLSVMHTFTQRGDLMRDPDIVFDLSGEEWVPVEVRQDPVQVHRMDEDGIECGDLLQMWAKNLDAQGFADKEATVN